MDYTTWGLIIWQEVGLEFYGGKLNWGRVLVKCGRDKVVG